jgi:hypothetical protein
MKWSTQLFKKFLEGISHNGEGSEKRQTKFAVVSVLLLLTAYDCFFLSQSLRIDILVAWFGLIGYDGYRTTLEKQTTTKPDEKQNP